MSIVSLTITGTVFIALALLVVLGVGTGISFNQLIPNMGNPLILIGIIAFVALIIAIIYR